MKVFNLENPVKGVPPAKNECVVIATWAEWSIINDAVEAHAKANPRSKKIKALNDAFEHLAVW